MRFRILAALALALAVPFALFADDKDDRSRKVRVAIAVAEAEAAARGLPTAADVAPAPRPAVLPYAEGYVKAKGDSIPLVVYVGYEGPKIEGTATVRVESYATSGGGPMPIPGVVVGYPIGGILTEEARLPGRPTTKEIERAADSARKKMDARPMPNKPVLPPPANAHLITADGVKAEACSCGDACKCQPGDCPGKCPVTYAQVVARIAKGERLYLSVGTQATGPQRVCGGGRCRLLDVAAAVDSLPGIAPGVYECFLLDGVAKMQLAGKVLPR